MNTLIGQRLREFPEGLALMTALCVGVIVIDFTTGYQNSAQWRHHSELVTKCDKTYVAVRAGEVRYETYLAAHETQTRAYYENCREGETTKTQDVLLAVLVLALFPVLANGRLASLGLVISPTDGWRYWCKAAPALFLALALVATAGGGIWLWSGGRITDITENYQSIPIAFVGIVLRAPFAEEVIYRMGVCATVAAWLGPRSAIVASGLLFGLIHIVHGSANPVNLVAGFVLAWAYMKSNTILVPLILHSFGNLVGWYIITECLVPLAHR